MPKAKITWRDAVANVNRKTLRRRIADALFATVMAWCAPFPAALALDLDGLDDVTMQVIDSDEDLTKAIPRVIEIPHQAESDVQPRSSRTPSARSRDLHDLPSAAVAEPSVEPSVEPQPRAAPSPVVAPDVPELHLPGDDIHTPFLPPPDTLIPLPIPNAADDEALGR